MGTGSKLPIANVSFSPDTELAAQTENLPPALQEAAWQPKATSNQKPLQCHQGQYDNFHFTACHLDSPFSLPSFHQLLPASVGPLRASSSSQSSVVTLSP